MRNSAAISELVDMYLFSALTRLFDATSCHIPLLFCVEADNGKWGDITILDVIQLIDDCSDLREIRALALFSWLSGFDDNQLVVKFIDVIQKKADVLCEAAIYHSRFCTPELRELLDDNLRRVRREHGFEYIIAYHALQRELTFEGKCRFVALASGDIQSLSIEEDLPIFAEYVTIADKMGNSVTSIFLALLSLVQSPPARGRGISLALEQWGMDYFSQLKLSYALQKLVSVKKQIRKSHQKESRLKERLSYELYQMERKWTGTEIAIVKSFHEWDRPLINCWENADVIPCCVDLTQQGDFPNSMDVTDCVLNSLQGLDEEGFQEAWNVNHVLIAQVASLSSRRSRKLLYQLLEYGCINSAEYPKLWKTYICLWESHDALEYVEEHGLDLEIVQGIDNFDFDFLTEEEISSLKELVVSWTLDNALGEFYRLFGESINNKELAMHWHSAEELKKKKSLLKDWYGGCTIHAVLQNPSIAEMLEEVKEEHYTIINNLNP